MNTTQQKKIAIKIKRLNKILIIKKKQSGSATVEAAIIMPLVILSFISILSIIRIVSTYGRMQHALNQVATELSEYSYLYAVSGVKQKHDELIDDINEAKAELITQSEAIGTFYKSIESLTTDINSLGKDNNNSIEMLISSISNIDNIQNPSNELIQNVNEILEDPMSEIQLIGLAFSDILLGNSKTTLLHAITKSMLNKKLSKDLEQEHIEKLSLSSSTFFSDKETIDIIVEYNVKPNLDIFIMPEIKLRNRACMLAWTYGVEHDTLSDTTSNINESVWNINKDKDSTSQHLGRGNKIDKLYASELKANIGEYAEITPYHFRTIDLIEYAHNGKDGSLITIFSLNPFLPTYNKKSAVIGLIKQNLHKLNTFTSHTVQDFTIDISLLSGDYKRIVYIIIPENDILPEPYIQAFEESKKLAKKMDIELLQVQKYGTYDSGEQNE